MPVIRQKMITRADMQRHPDRLYLFGDNEQREGLGGQAKEMRGEPNAVGIRTKRTPGTDESAYWSDGNYERVCELIDDDFMPVFEKLCENDKLTVVIPADGLGTGMAQLTTRAPETLEYIQEWIDYLVVVGGIRPSLRGIRRIQHPRPQRASRSSPDSS